MIRRQAKESRTSVKLEKGTHEKQATFVAHTSAFTSVRALGAAAGIGIVWLSLVCGPVALGLSAMAYTTPVAPVQNIEVGGLSNTDQQAGEFALQFVASWLSATRDDPGEFKKYASTGSMSLSPVPWVYRDLAVVEIDPDEKKQVVTASVAASIQTVDESGAVTWPRRYFQAVVQVSKSGFVPVGLPTPVAGPLLSPESFGLKYGTPLATTDQVSQTATAFLAAYLTGQSDVTRFSTPESSFTPVTPTPYSSMEIRDVRSDGAPEPDPKNGDTLKLLVIVDLQTGVNQRVNAMYALTVVARDSRWEVDSIDGTPLLDQKLATKLTATE